VALDTDWGKADMALPIKGRLTLWYAAILFVTLSVFGGAIYFAVRTAIMTSIDMHLEQRLAGAEQFMRQAIPRIPRGRLGHEFQESVQMQPGGEMMQISDSSGWIFQSESIRGLRLSAPDAHAQALATQVVSNVPLRIRASSLTIDGETYRIQLVATLDDANRALDRIVRTMFWFIPAVVLIASLGGYWLSRKALAPVDRIIEDSRTISFNNLSRRLMVPHTGDELERLSETLNDMIQRLESSFIRNAQFTADASHELRTPVAFIRTRAEVALVRLREPHVYEDALREILVETERMTRLIEELLILARTDAGSYRVPLSPLDLRQPLDHACTQAATMARNKQIAFATNLPDREAMIHGDATTLRRLFLILIDNAIKYTPEGGRIDVALYPTDSRICVAVRDSGIGIDPDEIDRIFDRFYRSDKARQRDAGGAGLGLPIGRWIAEAHRANIEVDSSLNAGSEFRVAFPHHSGR
jgi:heavy metal sensor kinase